MRVSTDIFVPATHLGVIKGIETVKNAGFDCFDMTLYGLWKSKMIDYEDIFGSNHLHFAKEVKSLIDSIGISCNQAHAPFMFQYGEKIDMSERNFSDLVASLEFASILGAKNIVVHAIKVPDGLDIFGYNEQFYNALAPYARDFGIRIAIENLFTKNRETGTINGYLHTPKSIKTMLSRLDPDVFTHCLDLGHAAITGTKPEDFIRSMDAGTLTCLHVQDTDYRDDRHDIPYNRGHNWQEIMQALADIDYRGELTFEVLNYFQGVPDDLLPDSLRYVERIGRHLTKMFDEAKKK